MLLILMLAIEVINLAQSRKVLEFTKVSLTDRVIASVG